MLKTILLLLPIIFFIPIVSYAEIHGEMELGYDQDHKLWEYSVDLELGHHIWKLYPKLNGAWYTFISNNTIQYQVYKIGYGIEIGNHFEINWSHFCIHNLNFGQQANPKKILFDYDDLIFQYGDKISVKYKF